MGNLVLSLNDVTPPTTMKPSHLATNLKTARCISPEYISGHELSRGNSNGLSTSPLEAWSSTINTFFPSQKGAYCMVALYSSQNLDYEFGAKTQGHAFHFHVLRFSFSRMLPKLRVLLRIPHHRQSCWKRSVQSRCSSIQNVLSEHTIRRNFKYCFLFSPVWRLFCHQGETRFHMYNPFFPFTSSK